MITKIGVKKMNKNFILSCCSTADLSAKHFEDIDVKYVYFHFELDGKEYYDESWSNHFIS